MANQFELTAEFREDVGKGASRRLRRAGKVPAILYGGGKEPRNISFDREELNRKLATEAFYSHILKINVGKDQQDAILKDMQRHPAKAAVLHLDLQRIVADEKIRMTVPLHFIGADIAHGVKQEGGTVSQLMSEVDVSCLPKDLPEYLEIDITDLQLGQVIHLSEITVPEGVELMQLAYGDQQDKPVVTIHHIKVAVEEEEAVEGEEVAEGEVPVAEAGAEEPDTPTEE